MKSMSILAVVSLAVGAAQAENLIQNGGFELSNVAMDACGYKYVEGENQIQSWTTGGSFVWVNAEGARVWNNVQACIAGNYSVAFQRGGWAEQAVTIPSAGNYELTWRSGKRNNNPDHTLVIKVDGVDVYTSTATWSYSEHQLISTGKLTLTGGAHVIGFYGVDGGVDATTFIDEVSLSPFVDPGTDEDVEVTEGTYEVGYPPPTGKITVSQGATVAVGAASHGILGVYRPLSPSRPFSDYAGQVYALSSLRQLIALELPVTNHFLSATGGAVFSVGDEYAGTLPDDFKEGGKIGDFWAAEWDAVLTIPQSGLYTFRATVDDAFALALDGRSVLQSQDCKPTVMSVYLEQGPHAAYIALLDHAASAGLKLEVKEPGDDAFKGLPLAWFTPMIGPSALIGKGDVAPADGTALVVAQKGLATAFTGRFAGEGTGAVVLKEAAPGSSGQLELSDVTGGAPYLVNGELAVTAPNRALASVGSSLNSGTLSLAGMTSITNLYGGQKTVLGAHLYVRPIHGNDTCGISTNRTYTHLKNFPLSSTDYPTVNGVTFSNCGEVDFATADYFGDYTTSSGWTGDKALYNTFSYGPDYSFVLKGLAPGKVYDYRFYFLAWGVGEGGSGRVGTFTFGGQDLAGNAVTFDAATLDVNAAFGSAMQESRGVIGCRFVAGADGQLKVSVKSANRNDTIHCYAFSNELVNDTAVTSDTVTLAPPEGARPTLVAELGGTDKVVVDGAGEQMLAGAVTLRQPLEVKSKLILARGADVKAGVNLQGATLEMRGGSKLAKLAGTGTLDFRWGDRHPFGDVQPDGTFAAVPTFRTEHFTCDADSGVSPTKNYVAAFNYWKDASDVVPEYDTVNEIGFRRVAPTGSNGFDFRSVNLWMDGTPTAMHIGGEENIGLSSDQGFYTLFRSFCYGGDNTEPAKYILIQGLTPGKTYEVRFYERLWGESDRRVQLDFWTDEINQIAESHTVYIDQEAATGPYYIAVRFTAQYNRYSIVHRHPNPANSWHLYAATVERVEDAANRRTLDLADDTDFAGAVTGCGFVEKTGAGKLRLTGDSVDASGMWYVDKGAVLLGNASASLGSVAVGTQGAFGGCGRVAGDVGVYADATLVVGDVANGSSLAVGGTLAIGEGAKLVVYGKGGLSAKAFKFPKALMIQSGEGVFQKLTIVSETAFGEDVDTSAWAVLRADGTVDKSARVCVAGNKIRVTRGGFALLVR